MIAHLFSSGRYGAYIWPAYGVTVLGFAWMIMDTLGRSRSWRRKSARLEKAEDT